MMTFARLIRRHKRRSLREDGGSGRGRSDESHSPPQAALIAGCRIRAMSLAIGVSFAATSGAHCGWSAEAITWKNSRLIRRHKRRSLRGMGQSRAAQPHRVSFAATSGAHCGFEECAEILGTTDVSFAATSGAHCGCMNDCPVGLRLEVSFAATSGAHCEHQIQRASQPIRPSHSSL